MDNHEVYMHRCLHLASLAAGQVAPNPMVGAVLVHNSRIIGEGYHRVFGQAHAEVNCVSSVNDSDKNLIAESTLYVSLEPCSHFGKTPPCTNLILENDIKKVVIGCRDPFKEVDGKGIEKLRENGVDVTVGILDSDAIELNKRFMTYHRLHRPYITLKWAQTGDGKIANADYSRLLISNNVSNRLVHKWRSEESSILVGTNTAFYDDPQLTARYWTGVNPVRLVIDMDLRLPSTLKLFDASVPTIVFNRIRNDEKPNLVYYKVTTDVNLVHQILHALYQLKITSVLVEGGSKLLQAFIDDGLWDEARIITNAALRSFQGLPSPILTSEQFLSEEKIGTDTIHYYLNANLNS